MAPPLSAHLRALVWVCKNPPISILPAKPLWPVWKFREGGEERGVEGNDYPPPYLDVFKISKGEESN